MLIDFDDDEDEEVSDWNRISLGYKSNQSMDGSINISYINQIWLFKTMQLTMMKKMNFFSINFFPSGLINQSINQSIDRSIHFILFFSLGCFQWILCVWERRKKIDKHYRINHHHHFIHFIEWIFLRLEKLNTFLRNKQDDHIILKKLNWKKNGEKISMFTSNHSITEKNERYWLTKRFSC